MPIRFKKISDLIFLAIAVCTAAGSVFGVIFLAALQWSDVQAATGQVKGLIEWKDSASIQIARMAQEVHDMHEWMRHGQGVTNGR